MNCVMKTLLQRILTLALTSSLLLLAIFPMPAAAGDKKVLFFSKSASFEHSAIKRENGQLSFVEKLLSGLGQTNHIEFTFTKDGRVFTPDNIAQSAAFFFHPPGDLTEPGTDGSPPMSK